MLIRRFSMFGTFGPQYREEAGPDGDAGGGGGDSSSTKNAEPEKGEGKDKGQDKDGKDDGNMTEKERELLREVMEKKKKLRAIEGELSTLREQLKQWEGLDPKQVRELLDQQKKAEQQQLEARGEYEKVKQQMIEAHNAEKKSLQEQIEALKSQLAERERHIDELTVGHAFATSKFIAEKLTLPPSKARTVFGAHFERDEQGRIVGYDKPRGAPNRAPLVDGNGEPLPFDEALAKLVEQDSDRDLLLRSTVKQGANSDSTNGVNSSGKANVGVGRARILAGLRDKKLTQGQRLNLFR